LEAVWGNIVMAAQAMTWQEVVAVFFGLLSVWYAKKENILVFPTGIISVLLISVSDGSCMLTWV